MSIILVIYAIVIIALTTMKYRNALKAALSIMFIFSLPTALMIAGVNHFESAQSWFVFGKNISRPTFLYLMAALYVFNAVCAALILRSHREYRRVNKK